MGLAKPSDVAPKRSAWADFPRDGFGRPLIVPPYGGKAEPYTRVTTFIDIFDKTQLGKWKMRELAKHVASTESAQRAVRAVAEDNTALNAVCERLLDEAGANAKRDKGTRRHLVSEAIDLDMPLPASADPEDIAIMGEYMLATVDYETVFAERPCVNPTYKVAGTPDRVYRCPDGKLRIADIKTGAFDYLPRKTSMQMYAYGTGSWYDPLVFETPDRGTDPRGCDRWRRKEWTADEAVQAYTAMDVVVDHGVLVHLTDDGCTVHKLDLPKASELIIIAAMLRDAPKDRDFLIAA